MHAITLFLMFNATRWRDSAVTFEMHSSVFCLNSSNVCGLILCLYQVPWVRAWHVHDMDEVLKSLQPYEHFRRIIHSEEKVFSVGGRNKVWRISSKLSSLNTDGRPERFLSCTLPVSRKRFTRRDTVNLFDTGESGNVSPKLILAS
jgi:hypothetical protein